MPRIYCPDPLSSGQSLTLPREASRHIQVLRLQPGSEITLFDGRGGEYDAVITAMGRQAVDVTIGRPPPGSNVKPPRRFNSRCACPRTSGWTGWSRRQPSWA